MEIDEIVRFDGRIVDFHGGLEDAPDEPRTLELEELVLVPDEGVIRLLTPATEEIGRASCRERV